MQLIVTRIKCDDRFEILIDIYITSCLSNTTFKMFLTWSIFNMRLKDLTIHGCDYLTAVSYI